MTFIVKMGLTPFFGLLYKILRRKFCEIRTPGEVDIILKRRNFEIGQHSSFLNY